MLQLADNTVCDTSKDAITGTTALVDLWTDAELLASLVNSSLGVACLSLRLLVYERWSESLVRPVFSLVYSTSAYPADLL